MRRVSEPSVGYAALMWGYGGELPQLGGVLQIPHIIAIRF
jgi:hypothetical protein